MLAWAVGSELRGVGRGAEIGGGGGQAPTWVVGLGIAEGGAAAEG